MAFWLSYLTYNTVVLCFDVPLFNIHSISINYKIHFTSFLFCRIQPLALRHYSQNITHYITHYIIQLLGFKLGK